MIRLFRRPLFAAAVLGAVLTLACRGPNEAAATPVATPPSATAAPASPAVSTASPTPEVTATRLPASPAPATATPVPVTMPIPVPPDAAAMVMAILASEMGVPVAEFKLLSYALVDWPDASLGCPVPGTSYAQVITPGWKILVGRRAEVYEFHTDWHGRLFINCTALKVKAGDTVNVAEKAGLKGATEVALLRRDATTGLFNEIEQLSAAAEVALFTRALDQPVPLVPRKDCQAIFKVLFKTPGGAQEFEFICAEDFQMLRGVQNYWGGKQGRAPAEFGDLIGKYAGRVPFPGLPGQ